MAIQIKDDDLNNMGLEKLIKSYHRYYWQKASTSQQPLSTIDQLKHQEIHFWTARDGNKPVGCIALKSLEPHHAEIKCLYVLDEYRSKGIGRQLIDHVIIEAGLQNFNRLSVEAAMTDGFQAIRALIEEYGFGFCSPFGDYFMDVNSQCVTLYLDNHSHLSKD